MSVIARKHVVDVRTTFTSALCVILIPEVSWLELALMLNDLAKTSRCGQLADCLRAITAGLGNSSMFLD